MELNKYTFLTSIAIVSAVTVTAAVGGMAYKMGMEKGRLDQASYWALQGTNSAIARVIEAVRYTVPENELNGKFKLLTNIKEVPLYIYEANGVRTVVAVCSNECEMDSPPGFYAK